MRAATTILLGGLLLGTGCGLQGIDDIAYFPDLGPDLAVADLSKPLDATPAARDLAAASDLAGVLDCSHVCPVCAEGELCIGAVDGATYATTCARRCATGEQCDVGESCVSLFGEQGAVCLKPGWPPICPGPADAGSATCAGMAPACLDAATLTLPWADFVNGACGVEHRHCAHGCAPSVNNQPAACNP